MFLEAPLDMRRGGVSRIGGAQCPPNQEGSHAQPAVFDVWSARHRSKRRLLAGPASPSYCQVRQRIDRLFLTNFDTADSGSGNIYSYNGQSVNWYVQWTRDDEGNVTITYQGTLNSTLKEAAKESDGGDATLNDGNNTPGSWTRS